MLQKTFTLLIFPLAIWASDALQMRTQVLMGTFVDISLAKPHQDKTSEVFNAIRILEKTLSSYDKNALLYQLNQKHTIAYNSTLAEIIDTAKKYHKDTHGYFDITIGSISKNLYHFGEDNNTIPSKNALNSAILNINGIKINRTHIHTNSNITVDLGGIAKGYTVDKVSDYLKEQNISQGIIALSGDIRCLNICELEIQSPYSEQTFARLSTKRSNTSISTSGTYRRYVKTKEHHHLINPKTARQGKAFHSISLFTQANNTKIDAYATALSVMPKEKALVFLKQHKELGFIVVTAQGKIYHGNLEQYLKVQWLDYKERSNMLKENNLSHPDTKNPVR